MFSEKRTAATNIWLTGLDSFGTNSPHIQNLTVGPLVFAVYMHWESKYVKKKSQVKTVNRN